MQSHFVLLVVFSFFVSIVFATITKEEITEQLRLGGLLFAGFVLSALVLGWFLYPFPL
jgi:hypothetical protein